MKSNLSTYSVSCLRSLVIDQTTNAKSGHPGLALGSAPLVYVLFKKHLNASSLCPDLINRDRFILSSGHASSLLYAILHLSKYNITIDDLQNFRKLGSITPGHPEIDHHLGIECSSGPLGQGISQAVGVALANVIISSLYDSDGHYSVSHKTYCLCGDGDLEEGISQEALNLAGLWNLKDLILIYDKNDITLDGKLGDSSIEDTKLRFKALNFNVYEIADGNDLNTIDKTLRKARKSNKPVLIINHTIIGFGSKNQGSNKVHGNPLSKEDALDTKLSYGYNNEPFIIDEDVYEDVGEYINKRMKKFIRNAKKNIALLSSANKNYAFTYNKYADLDILELVQSTFPKGYKEASRNTSKKILNCLKESKLFIGGSADVASSVMTRFDGIDFFNKDKITNSIQYGIREFAMASINNGILIHGGLYPFCGSFLVFADYLKAAVRMSALQNLPSLYLFSHDSIAVGEDGPTHQPIEQLAMLRSIPNTITFRPGDANEVSYSYRYYLENLKSNSKKPISIILSRQDLIVNQLTNYNDFIKGGYIYDDCHSNNPDLVLVATGSEVNLAVAVKNILAEYEVRVVSLPSFELFDAQDDSYKIKVLGNDYKKVMTLEMLSTYGFAKYGKYNYGINSFGASGNYVDMIEHFGFTPEAVIKYIKEYIL